MNEHIVFRIGVAFIAICGFILGCIFGFIGAILFCLEFL